MEAGDAFVDEGWSGDHGFWSINLMGITNLCDVSLH